MNIWVYPSIDRPNRVSRFLLGLAILADVRHWARVRQIQYFGDRWIVLISENDAPVESDRGREQS